MWEMILKATCHNMVYFGRDKYFTHLSRMVLLKGIFGHWLK
jgi:hypothetical protein